MIDLVVAGPPVGKGRPRFVRATGQTYTPTETRSAELRIEQAWINEGRPTLGFVPLGRSIEVALRRPRNHYRLSGGLSAAGLREPYPMRKPDDDNVLKLYGDALSKRAYDDDRQFVHTTFDRRWTVDGELEHVRLQMWPMVGAEG